jgi:hypothetical protein
MPLGDSSDVTPQSFLNRPPDQVAYVVRDLESAVHEFGAALGISRWFGYIYDLDYLPRRTYRGDDASWISRVAVPAYGPSLEIIASEGGPSVFSEFLEARGPGLHHLGYFVPSLDEAVAIFANAGLPVVQSGGGHGVDGDGQFAFVDMTGTFGSYVELIEPPARRHAPHFEIRTE